MTDTKNNDKPAAGSVEAVLKDWEGYAFSIEQDERNGDLCDALRAIRAALASAKPVAVGELPPLPFTMHITPQGRMFTEADMEAYAKSYGQQCADSRPAGGVADRDAVLEEACDALHKDLAYPTEACAIIRSLKSKPAATLAASAALPAADLYSVALKALETLRGCAATYVEDHSRDTYPGERGLRPQDVANMWAQEIHAIDAKAFLDEAIVDAKLPAASAVQAGAVLMPAADDIDFDLMGAMVRAANNAKRAADGSVGYAQCRAVYRAAYEFLAAAPNTEKE